MTSKIEQLYHGSQASPVASADVEAGDYVLNHDGNATAAIAFDATAATIEGELEGLASIGSGNIAVADTANGRTFTYQGALADTDVVEDLTASSVTLKQKADTITVTVDQAGIAPVDCVPSINTITTAAVAVNEVQRVDLGGATTGTFDLNGNATSATVATLDESGIQAACDTIWGLYETVVSDIGGGFFSVTFSGSTWDAQDIPEMTVSANTTDGSPIVTTTTEGSLPISQVDEVTFDSVAVAGTMNVDDGDDIDWNESAAATASITGATLSDTTPASGSITITWDDDQPHTPVAVTTGTLKSVVGQHDITSITLTDEPTEGSLRLVQNGAETNTFSFETSSTSVEGLIEGMAGGFPCNVTSITNGWNVESDNNIAAVEWSAAVVEPLRKSVDAEIVTVQEGSAAATTPDAPSNLVATPLSASVIRLTWTDESDNEDAFEIERSPDGVSDWSQIGTTAANAVLFDSTGLTAETQYFYRVRAANGAGESDWVEADATTDAAPGGDSGSAFPFLFNSGILG